MSSEAVIKCVAKKLKYYFDVKRLEDGFDLSGVNSPQLDHPPLKSRPTLQYDGLHDRALKHYFSLPEVKVRLTQMGPGKGENREHMVKRKLKTTMRRHNYLMTRGEDQAPPLYLFDTPKSEHKSTTGGRHKSPTPLPEYAYMDTRKGRRLRKDMTGFGVLLKSQKQKSLKGGWPLLRSVPNHNVSKVEAERLVSVATKLLVATETVETLHTTPTENKRPQSAPKPFETSKALPHTADDDKVTSQKARSGSAKYTWDIHGRRHKKAKNKSYEDNYDSAYTTRSGSGSSLEFRRRRKEQDAHREADSPVPPSAAEPRTQVQEIEVTPEPPRTRPRSAKRRTRQRTVIQVSDSKVGEDVAVHSGTQTNDNGNQTDRRLLDHYNPLEEIVESGEWAEYQIYVRTGNRIGASTKADVKVTLYGEKGRTKEFPLDKSRRHKVCFQKGKEDLFIIPAHHVGKLLKMKIGHDRTELSNAWYLESVTVYDMHDKRIFEFVCERWLSGADGDRKTYRELEVDRERAFIQALEEEDTEEVYPSDGGRDSSTESTDRHRISVKAQGSVKTRSTKTNTHPRSRSRSYSDSESDSSSSSSSTTTYTTTTTATTTTNTTVTPARKEKDEFFDTSVKSGGPTYTFRKIKEGESDTGSKLASIDESSNDGQEYLHGYKAGLEAVQEEKRKQVDEENEERRKLLRGPTIHEAAEKGDLPRVRELLDNFPEMLEHTNEHGYTPLHVAAEHGQVDVVKWLTVHNVSLNKETATGYTAIHLAAMKGHVNCLMILAAMGAAITCRSSDKKTPLYLAAREGHLECVKWLVANRSRLDVKDDMGRTPREVAEEYRHEEVAKFLRACEDEMTDPQSGFAQMRTGKTGRAGLSPIREDASSTGDERTIWADDTEDSSLKVIAGSEQSGPVSAKASQREKEEKRHIYEEQHKKMEKTGDTFLDAIRHELEGSEP